MTDVAKCMVPGKEAGRTAPRRYANCVPWLSREVALFRETLCAIIPMGDEAHTWCLAFAQESWPTITDPIVHSGHRFTKKFTPAQTDYNGLPSDTDFAAFAARCDSRAKKRLDSRRRALLARWQVQFAEIKADLKRMGA